MLDDDVTVVRRPDVLWRSIPGYLIVATLDDVVHEAAGPAPEIWQAIERPTAIGELVSLLAQEYAVAPGQISSDVVEFLSELVAAGAVEALGPRPA